MKEYLTCWHCPDYRDGNTYGYCKRNGMILRSKLAKIPKRCPLDNPIIRHQEVKP